MHPNRRKGVQAEREAAAILSDLLGVKVTRRYNLGTHEDVGDLILPSTCVQVANYQSLDRAVREKLPELERQQANAGATFAAMFCRRRGGKYVVVLSPEMFCTLLREAWPQAKEEAA